MKQRSMTMIADLPSKWGIRPRLTGVAQARRGGRTDYREAVARARVLDQPTTAKETAANARAITST